MVKTPSNIVRPWFSHGWCGVMWKQTKTDVAMRFFGFSISFFCLLVELIDNKKQKHNVIWCHWCPIGWLMKKEGCLPFFQKHSLLSDGRLYDKQTMNHVRQKDIIHRYMYIDGRLYDKRILNHVGQKNIIDGYSTCIETQINTCGLNCIYIYN